MINSLTKTFQLMAAGFSRLLDSREKSISPLFHIWKKLLAPFFRHLFYSFFNLFFQPCHSNIKYSMRGLLTLLTENDHWSIMNIMNKVMAHVLLETDIYSNIHFFLFLILFFMDPLFLIHYLFLCCRAFYLKKKALSVKGVDDADGVRMQINFLLVHFSIDILNP